MSSRTAPIPDHARTSARIERLFRAVREIAPSRRAAFLAGSDESQRIRDAVAELLAHEGGHGSPPSASPLAPFPSAQPRIVPVAISCPVHIGPYRVIRVLGKGSNGIVYLAQREAPIPHDSPVDLPATVAIKVLRPGTLDHADLRRFQLERDLGARLNHPGIAKVHSAGWLDDGLPYLVMDFVEGTTITRHAANLDLNTKLRLAVSICRAVQHAHAKGVLHRDLKPANILIDALGNPKVLDFGEARLVTATPWRETATGQLIGTLEYMSPEQAQGSNTDVDVRSDVYSLGAVFYELLAGWPPIAVAHKPVLEAVRLIVESAPAELRTGPRDARSILTKALAKNPRDRYQSVAQLGDDLQRVLDDVPVNIQPVPILRHLAAFATRHRTAVIAAFVVLLAAIVSLTWVLQARHREHEYFGFAKQSLASIATTLEYLHPRSGSLEDRRRLIDLHRTNVEQLVQQHPDDAEATFVLARLINASADLDLEVGQPGRAEPKRQRAMQLLAALSSRHPENPDFAWEHSLALVREADLQRGRVPIKQVERAYQRVLAIQEQLAASTVLDIRREDDLAWSYHRLSDVALEQKDFAAALRWCDRQQSASEGLIAKQRGRPASYSALFESFMMRETIAATIGDSVQRESAAQSAMRIASHLTQLDPGNKTYLARYAAACRIVVTTRLAQHDLTGASELIATIDAIAESLANSDPASTDAIDARLQSLNAHQQLAILLCDDEQIRCTGEEIEALVRASHHQGTAHN